MNKQLTKVGLQAVQRHPREALHISLLASKHPRTVAKMIKTTRRASRLTTTVKLAASNPKVATEARLAVSDLARAALRARRVGVVKAFSDRDVASQLRKASSHASNAVAAARNPQPSHRFVRMTAITAGAGALSGAVYARWRAHSRAHAA